VSGRQAAQRSARPARPWAPPGLRLERPTELLRPKAARYAPARLRGASLVFPRREAGRPPELEQVPPLVCRADAPRLPAVCLFGACPLEASARLETPAQLAQSSPPEVPPLEVLAAACVRAALQSAARAPEQP
jgi:hypothetical protein